MKKLGKLNLSDAKVMDVHEMKAITGGQSTYQSCQNTSTTTGINGGPANMTCSGECPTVQPPATGNTGPTISKTCAVRKLSIGVGGPLYYCGCD